MQPYCGHVERNKCAIFSYQSQVLLEFLRYTQKNSRKMGGKFDHKSIENAWVLFHTCKSNFTGAPKKSWWKLMVETVWNIIANMWKGYWWYFCISNSIFRKPMSKSFNFIKDLLKMNGYYCYITKTNSHWSFTKLLTQAHEN